MFVGFFAFCIATFGFCSDCEECITHFGAMTMRVLFSGSHVALSELEEPKHWTETTVILSSDEEEDVSDSC